MRTAAEEYQPSPVIVWLHGAGMDRTVFSIIARDPQLGFARAFFPELRGAATIAAYAKEVTEQLDAHGIGPAALVGHSMGALVALAIAQAAPARVRALLLAGAAARMPVNPALLALADTDLPAAARMIAGYAIAGVGRRAAPATPGIRLGGAAVALLERSPPGRLAGDLRTCAAFDRPIERLDLPALVVTGNRDRMTPARKGAELAASLGADHAMIESAGHMMMLERPQAFADLVVPFLRRTLGA